MLFNSFVWSTRTKEIMQSKGVTVSGIARALNLSRVYVSAVINGRVFSQRTMERISNYLSSRP